MQQAKETADTRPLRVAGEADGSSNPFVSLTQRLVVGEAPVVLDLTELKISEEFAVTQCVNALRELLVRGAHVVMTGVPAVLAEGFAHAGLLQPPTTLRIETRD